MKSIIYSMAILGLAPAVARAAEEEGVSVVPTDWGLWIWTLVTFLAMFFLLAKLAFKPIGEALDRRAKTIQQSMDDAKTDREEAKKLMAGYENKIAEAHGEANKLIEEARQMGESVRNEVVVKAKGEATELMQRAREEIHREKEKGVQELKDTVAGLSVQIASKVIEKEINKAQHKKLVENLIDDLGKIEKAN